jgi:hypothetical protein
VGLTNRLRRLEVGAEEEMIVIPTKDGTVARFSQRAGEEALLALMDGHDHPIAEAARTSPDPRWTGSFYSAFPRGEAEDLS